MINLRNAELTDSLPEIVGRQPWAKAISYAVSQLIYRLLDMADVTRSFSAVDEIKRHDILDALAVDLLVVQYDTNYDIETKRKLIKYALQYWATAGTKKATEDVLKKILNDGFITEWYEYGGDPGYFKVNLSNNEITTNDIIKFKGVAENVKRLSAWLDKVVLDMVNDPQTQRVGFIEHTATFEETKQKREPNQFYGFIIQESVAEVIKQEA